MLRYSIVIIAFTAITACSGQAEQDASMKQAPTAQVQLMRHHDIDQIQRGRQLFLNRCAVCHGGDAQGAPNWSQPDVNGKYPAPPLNGSGHAWHHSKAALVNTINNGTARMGGNMPAWQDKLSGQDINDIITWFQSLWPDELYVAWQRMDQMSQQSGR